MSSIHSAADSLRVGNYSPGLGERALREAAPQLKDAGHRFAGWTWLTMFPPRDAADALCVGNQSTGRRVSALREAALHLKLRPTQKAKTTLLRGCEHRSWAAPFGCAQQVTGAREGTGLYLGWRAIGLLTFCIDSDHHVTMGHSCMVVTEGTLSQHCKPSQSPIAPSGPD